MAADKKLNSVNLVKDASYVYAETASGETVKIAKADLASVVAEQMGKRNDSYNANDLKKNGIYYAGNGTNFPASYCYILVIKAIETNEVIQLGLPVLGASLFRRVSNGDSWSDWSKVEFA